MSLINQPLLMIAGSNADTFYLTEQCFSHATSTQDKELFLISGARHNPDLLCTRICQYGGR
ncbi:MAG: hypothetical protein SOY26_02330 [Paludibacteraceae bacterium]|nr:hypothetical protein [Paludibacteraceae bacterium]